MTGNEFWLSSMDAAERVGVRQRTLYGFVNRGELPGYRFGRVFRFKVADVERFIESRRIEPGSITYAPAAKADKSA